MSDKKVFSSYKNSNETGDTSTKYRDTERNKGEIKEDSDGDPIFSFSNSPQMHEADARSAAQKAEDAQRAKDYERRMQYIKENGALPFSTELPSERTFEIMQMGGNGEVDKIYDIIKENLMLTFANKKYWEMAQNYYELAQKGDPELISRLVAMAVTSESIKNEMKSR